MASLWRVSKCGQISVQVLTQRRWRPAAAVEMTRDYGVVLAVEARPRRRRRTGDLSTMSTVGRQLTGCWLTCGWLAPVGGKQAVNGHPSLAF